MSFATESRLKTILSPVRRCTATTVPFAISLGPNSTLTGTPWRKSEMF